MELRDQKLYKLVSVGGDRWNVYEGNRCIAYSIFWTKELGVEVLYDYTGIRYAGDSKYVSAFIDMYDDLKSKIGGPSLRTICGITLREIINET